MSARSPCSIQYYTAFAIYLEVKTFRFSVPTSIRRIRTCAENDAVVIEVEDNGVGMEEATQQRLFERFFTTKDADRGTGLGLSIIYAIVRNHDGEIAVESEEGVGTTFKVMLPVMERDLPSV